ncbi:MAG: hypothetical protein DRQ42_08615 [Gammaproteobacteria bacterium]|nr:MAG: hypothetical protein DRQ42_08615 [Gammaproteobacteria bacterium]
MIYSNEDIYHALRVRILGNKISGTLFYSNYDIDQSLKYWASAKHEGYYTNPWGVLTKDLVSQINRDSIKIMANLLKINNPPFTLCEQQYIINKCNKYKYTWTIFDNHIYL